MPTPAETLAQVMALSRGGSSVGGLGLDPVPQLGGRFASIDPAETERYNKAWREWQLKAETRLAEELARIQE